MPRIFDNIDQQLLPGLRETLEISSRADFSAGYFNLRGWKQIDSLIESRSGREGHCCRLLVGRQSFVKMTFSARLVSPSVTVLIDNETALGLKKKLAENYREQLAKSASVLRGLEKS